MALMGIAPFGNFVGADEPAADALPETSQPRFYFNKSGRFESRFPTGALLSPGCAASTSAADMHVKHRQCLARRAGDSTPCTQAFGPRTRESCPPETSGAARGGGA